MANAEAAVRAAREVGAERVPSAELQLKLAREEIQKAQALSSDGRNDEADTMLQRAAADAELALALAHEQEGLEEAARNHAAVPANPRGQAH